MIGECVPGPREIDPVAAQWRALGRRASASSPARGAPVGRTTRHPHTCPVPGHNLSHLARAATADQLGEVL